MGYKIFLVSLKKKKKKKSGFSRALNGKFGEDVYRFRNTTFFVASRIDLLRDGSTLVRLIERYSLDAVVIRCDVDQMISFGLGDDVWPWLGQYV